MNWKNISTNVVAALIIALLTGIITAMFTYKSKVDAAINDSMKALEASKENKLIVSRNDASIERLKNELNNVSSDYSELSVRLDTQNCDFTEYLNNFDGVLNFTCPSGTAVAGIFSEHHGRFEDRRFKLKCCSVVLDR